MRGRLVELYGERVGYTPEEQEKFREGGHRVRHVEAMARAAAKHSIAVTVTESKNCNSGHAVGQRLVLDVDGNLITGLCPKKVCVYLVSQLAIPVALINERFSEGLDPTGFHFGRVIRCPDAGVECLGYGSVTAKVEVVARLKA